MYVFDDYYNNVNAGSLSTRKRRDSKPYVVELKSEIDY